jgi:hypothetical protein
MMVPLKARRSTMAAQRRGSVKILVQPPQDSLEAMANAVLLLSFAQDLEEEFGAVAVALEARKAAQTEDYPTSKPAPTPTASPAPGPEPKRTLPAEDLPTRPLDTSPRGSAEIRVKGAMSRS